MSDVNELKISVSIALCTYNGAKYLEEQIESILNQDYAFINEIICIDDNSTDSTWEILKQYAKSSSVFRIFQNPINLGFIKNFEKAIALTTNQFIAISDQDDIWYPTKISKLVDKIGDSLMVYSDNEYIDAEGKKIGIRFSEKRNLVKTNSCLNFAIFNAVSGHTILFNRELLDFATPFPSDLHYDWWLAFNASQHISIRVVNEPLVGYRQHEKNAVGGYGVRESDKRESKFVFKNEAIVRLQTFSNCLDSRSTYEKSVLEFLAMSYIDKSLTMRFKRISVFWKNRNTLLLFKRRSKFRKMIYCIKAFWKYD